MTEDCDGQLDEAVIIRRIAADVCRRQSCTQCRGQARTTGWCAICTVREGKTLNVGVSRATRSSRTAGSGVGDVHRVRLYKGQGCVRVTCLEGDWPVQQVRYSRKVYHLVRYAQLYRLRCVQTVSCLHAGCLSLCSGGET